MQGHHWETSLAQIAREDRVAVLAGGGLDSAVLCALLSSHCASVHPLFIRFGLLWEDAELAHFRKFLAAIQCSRIREVVTLSAPMNDVYSSQGGSNGGSHWSLTGTGVPDAASEDSAVELPGRNLLLIAKSAVWCAAHDIHAIAMGILSGNPFPDATSDFFHRMEAAVSLALSHPVVVLRPFAELTKADVIGLGVPYPLHLTFSCIDPVKASDGESIHCGVCNKCAERRRGFEDAKRPDPTPYAAPKVAKDPQCIN